MERMEMIMMMVKIMMIFMTMMIFLKISGKPSNRNCDKSWTNWQGPVGPPQTKNKQYQPKYIHITQEPGIDPPPLLVQKTIFCVHAPYRYIMNDENKYHSFCSLDMQQKCQNDKSYYFFLICFLTDDFFHSIELHN